MIKKILKIVQSIRCFYWWFVRPSTRGVRAIVMGHDGKIILVRHKYQEGWFLPGGKVGRNEKDESALRRELWEELGVDTISHLEKLGEYSNVYEYKKDTIIVFVAHSFVQKSTQHFEIEEQESFDPHMLPDETSPGTRRRIEEWLGQRMITNQW